MFGLIEQYPASHVATDHACEPAATSEPVVRIYGARCSGWVGVIAIHTWIAVRPSSAKGFRVYQVIGRRARADAPVVVVRDKRPDADWYGNTPQLLAEKHGAGVDELIARIETAVRQYPYPNRYRAWPGPNSNTFTAYVARAVPELELDLPPTAIGKDYLDHFIGASYSLR